MKLDELTVDLESFQLVKVLATFTWQNWFFRETCSVLLNRLLLLQCQWAAELCEGLCYKEEKDAVNLFA